MFICQITSFEIDLRESDSTILPLDAVKAQARLFKKTHPTAKHSCAPKDSMTL